MREVGLGQIGAWVVGKMHFGFCRWHAIPHIDTHQSCHQETGFVGKTAMAMVRSHRGRACRLNRGGAVIP